MRFAVLLMVSMFNFTSQATEIELPESFEGLSMLVGENYVVGHRPDRIARINLSSGEIESWTPQNRCFSEGAAWVRSYPNTSIVIVHSNGQIWAIDTIDMSLKWSRCRTSNYPLYSSSNMEQGLIAVSDGFTNTVEIIDIESGAEVNRFVGKYSGANSFTPLVFVRDTRSLFAGSDMGLHKLDLETGQESITTQKFGSWNGGFSYRDDGYFITHSRFRKQVAVFQYPDLHEPEFVVDLTKVGSGNSESPLLWFNRKSDSSGEKLQIIDLKTAALRRELPLPDDLKQISSDHSFGRLILLRGNGRVIQVVNIH